MKRYVGKSVCQGCGKPGTDVPRFDINSLCDNCSPIFDKGRRIDFLEREEFVRIYQHVNAFKNRALNVFAHDLLSGLHNPYVTGRLEYAERITGRKADLVFLGSSKHYTIPKRCVEPLSNFLMTLDEKYTSLEKSLKDIPRLAKEEIALHRREIFDAGVEEGRNLLLSLTRKDLDVANFQP